MTTINFRSGVTRRLIVARGLLAALSVGLAGLTLSGQSVISGSDGSDGALAVAANEGIIVFDPVDIARWGRVLDPDGDGAYNFTTITISAGSTLRFRSDKVNKPVYWLASGDVVINGTIDFAGAAGVNVGDNLSLRRQVAIPGSGGYAGGAGGIGSVLATSGEGPAGGSAGTVAPSDHGRGGFFTGNRYLIPLAGGSGGGGALGGYLGGGAGGGAILIASSTSIALGGGTISAAGGNGAGSGGNNPLLSGAGSGGSIRLVAPNLSGNGTLNISGGTNPGPGFNFGGAGWVRLEGFTISSSLNVTGGANGPGGNFTTRGSPIDPSTLRPVGSIRVTAIDGKTVSSTPSGSFVVADVSISKNVPVSVDIEARGIPHGTVVTLQVFPQTPENLSVVYLPTAQATLSGTLQLSTATATFTFPYGFSRGFVRASWTQ